VNAKRIGTAFGVLCLAGIAGYVGTRVLFSPPSPGTPAESGGLTVGPVARVEVVPIREGTVDVVTTAIGTVEAALGETETFSVPFESRITRVRVVDGQPVEAGEVLVELEPSPDAVLQVRQARQERDAARNQLDLAKQRMEMKLLTRQDLLQAEQALSAAELSVRSMEERGMNGEKTLRADAQGIVSRVDVQQGQVVPGGSALVETIGQNQIMVRLGVESEDANRLQVGQEVLLEPVYADAERFGGKIFRMTREVNPQTRLVSVYVTPEAGAPLLLNEFVRGRMIIESQRGLVVPSEAVLPGDGAPVLFTVADGHAVKHEVELGPEGDGQVVVIGPSLRVGEPVVTAGNSELEVGMAVNVEPHP
jgi:membrane fusion protein, multidrug efflux system